MKFFKFFFFGVLTVLLLTGSVYGQCNVQDDFSGTTINTSIWNVVSGSWSQNGQLTGYWSISAAQTDQGNILLVDGLQPSGDYTVEVDEVVSPFGQYKNGHQTFVLYHSPGNKYNISFGCENTAFGMEYRQGGSNYHTLVVIYSIPYFNTTPGQVNHTKLVRTGNHFQCYLNDHLIHEFDETIFGGDVKIGTGCYGTATYDNFCLTTGGQPQSQLCDEFDGASINTSMWNPVSGTWTQQNGQITGYWSLSDAYGEQANLVLTDAVQPTGDYTFEAEMVNVSGQNGHRVVLYNSAGNKYNIIFEEQQPVQAGAQVKVNGGIYQNVGIPFTPMTNFDSSPNAINHIKIVKTGNQFAVYMNNSYLFTLTDTQWNGNVNIGLGAYGYATYERACITTGGQPPQPNVWAISPEDNATSDVTGGVTFTWGSAGGPFEFFLEFSTKPDITTNPNDPQGVFAEPIGGVRLNEHSWASFVGYFPPGDYYWHVGAYQESNLVAYTPIRHFSVPGTGVSRLILNEPVISGDYMMFTGQAVDRYGHAVPSAWIYCDDPVGRRCIQEYTGIDGSFSFLGGPLSTAPRRGLATFEFISGEARTLRTISDLLPNIADLHPTPTEFSSMLSTFPSLSGVVSEVKYDLNNPISFSSAPKPIEVPPPGSPMLPVTHYTQYDDYGRVVGSVDVGLDQAIYLGKSNRTLLDFEYMMEEKGYDRIYKTRYRTTYVPDPEFPWADFAQFGISGTFCLSAGVPSGGAACIPFVASVGKAASWSLINEQIKKGNLDPNNWFLDLVKKAEVGEAVLELFLLPFNVYNNVKDAVPGQGNRGIDAYGHYVPEEFGWGSIIRPSEGQALYSVGYYDMDLSQRFLVNLNWLNSAFFNTKEVTSFLVPEQPNNGSGVAEVSLVLDDGTPAKEMIVVNTPTALVVTGHCPFRMCLTSRSNLRTGWVTNDQSFVDSIPLSYYSGPEGEPQEIVILQPIGEYDLELEGTDSVMAQIQIAAYYGGSRINITDFSSMMAPGKKFTLPFSVYYAKDKPVAGYRSRGSLIPGTWYLSWLSSHTGRVKAYIGNLPAGHTVDEIVTSSVRLNDTVAVLDGLCRIIPQVEGFNGSVLEVSFDAYKSVNSLSDVAVGESSAVLISGILADQSMFIAQSLVKVEEGPGYASISGFIKQNDMTGLLGVCIDLYDSVGALLQSVITDDSGYYRVDSIPNGNYSISVVTPLGYQADQETKEFTVHHVPVRVDFSLTKLATTPRQRSCAYWAEQLCKALQNKPKDYTRANFSRFAGLINVHFNQNEVNPVNFYTVPQPANQNDSLMVMKKILTMCNNENEPLLKRLAKAQLMALMLNVVSGKIHQTQTISADNRTVSQAITFCDRLIGGEINCPDNIPGHNNPNCPYILSELILNLINVGVTVPRNLIPANVIQIAYDINIPESVPEHFALNQNYPNPFNPVCEISYALPTDCHVTLTIYNVLGQRVKVLVDEFQNAGNKIVSWDSKDDQGQEVTSGVYFYRIQAGDFVQSKKMVLMK